MVPDLNKNEKWFEHESAFFHLVDGEILSSKSKYETNLSCLL